MWDEIKTRFPFIFSRVEGPGFDLRFHTALDPCWERFSSRLGHAATAEDAQRFFCSRGRGTVYLWLEGHSGWQREEWTPAGPGPAGGGGGGGGAGKLPASPSDSEDEGSSRGALPSPVRGPPLEPGSRGAAIEAQVQKAVGSMRAAVQQRVSEGVERSNQLYVLRSEAEASRAQADALRGQLQSAQESIAQLNRAAEEREVYVTDLSKQVAALSVTCTKLKDQLAAGALREQEAADQLRRVQADRLHEAQQHAADVAVLEEDKAALQAQVAADAMKSCALERVQGEGQATAQRLQQVEAQVWMVTVALGVVAVLCFMLLYATVSLAARQ